MTLITDLVTFLANPPGNMVYILAVAFTLIGTFQGALSQWRISGYPQAGRLVFGLGLLLGIQLILFLFSGLIEQEIIDARSLLPVLDRAVMLLSLVWMIWVWAFPESSRPGDAATVLLSLLIAVATVFGYIAYLGTQPTPGSFNGSGQGFYWDIGGILIAMLGMGILILRKPVSWANGLVVALLALIGFSMDIFFVADGGDYSGMARFWLLTAFPLLFSLPLRFPATGSSQQVRVVVPPEDAELRSGIPAKAMTEAEAEEEARERRRYSTDPKTLQSLLSLAAEGDPARVNQLIVRSTAHALLVDLCFLIFLGEDENSLYIVAGYDLIREENLDGGIIKREAVPMLANAVFRGRALRLPASATSADLNGLGELLGLPNPGNLLNVPIMADSGPIGAILLLSPYSNRVWSADDQAILTSVATSFVPILERSKRVNQVEAEKEQVTSSAKEAADQLARLKTVNAEITRERDELKTQAQGLADELAIMKEQPAVDDLLSSDDLDLRMASVALPVQAAANSQVENELRMTLVEMARLQNQLAESNQKILQLENRQSLASGANQSEVIASVAQELRQPMSSVIGYADLLLGESVGILGALQRKFIERIRTSTERIGSLVDDLIQMTALESGTIEVKPETVDLNLIIDNTMALTSGQMREKNIAMRIDIPENLAPLHADREALQQILLHLLQNAGAASPVEGSVTLRVRIQEESGNEYMIIQVSDSGGGIPKEDLPRVFSRLYRAENALIQGVGDTGVGLSIAKTLTDAQEGRIWVDTELGVGSTFSVSLPLKSVVNVES